LFLLAGDQEEIGGFESCPVSSKEVLRVYNPKSGKDAAPSAGEFFALRFVDSSLASQHLEGSVEKFFCRFRWHRNAIHGVVPRLANFLVISA
jgi:hypothetical protein